MGFFLLDHNFLLALPSKLELDEFSHSSLAALWFDSRGPEVVA
jgi:hypothetical protein